MNLRYIEPGETLSGHTAPDVNQPCLMICTGQRGDDTGEMACTIEGFHQIKVLKTTPDQTILEIGQQGGRNPMRVTIDGGTIMYDGITAAPRR